MNTLNQILLFQKGDKQSCPIYQEVSFKSSQMLLVP